MSLAQLLPTIPGISSEKMIISQQSVYLELTSNSKTSSCPLCGFPSQSIHSHYYRKLKDVPWALKPVEIRIRARRFYCRIESCERKVFTERFPQELQAYARRTERANTCLEALGIFVGGRVGAYLSELLGMLVSPSTMLRIISRCPNPSFETPRVLGVDDWAFKKGASYGTILVDLEKNQPIDLLPDRTAETLASWLKEHPGVEIISRDRATGYASGSKEGAPDAIQVADRWHLLKNMREELQKALEAHSKEIKEVSLRLYQANLPKAEEQDLKEEYPAQRENPSSLSEPKTSQELQKPEKSQQEVRFEKVKQLQASGMTVARIAREVGITRKTVYQYLRMDTYHASCCRTTKLTPFIGYISQRLGVPELSKKDLWEEIVERGYTGNYRGFCHTLCSYFPEQKGETKKPAKLPMAQRYSAKKLSFCLLKESDALSGEEQAFLKELCQHSAQINTITSFIGHFFQMVRKRNVDEFDPWLKNLEESQIESMVGLAQRVCKDYQPIKAAMSMEWSNGQVEGQVNRLKLIKRQMYGRGGFELLKKKVLYRTRDG